VSPAGARGVAQIMPGTARAWGVNADDPYAALDAAAKHMAQYVKQYGSYAAALTAYNAGPGAVGHKLPAETVKYINKILGPGGRSGNP
jgi:soluble lytic murein transglycosylase-like protein